MPVWNEQTDVFGVVVDVPLFTHVIFQPPGAPIDNVKMY